MGVDARAALWALASAGAFALMEAVVKLLGAHMGPFQITFFRCAVQVLATLPFILRGGKAALRTARWPLHLARTLAGYVSMVLGFTALQLLDLAKAVALGFARPLFLVVLAVLFLGERVRWRRWTATAIGFLGVVVMVRPGLDGLSPGVVVALAGALSVAFVTVFLKLLSATERPETMVFFFGLTSAGLSVPAAWWTWRPVDGEALALAVAVGALGTLGQYTIIRAYRLVEATQVEPVDYTRLVFAAALGYAIFGELPDGWTVLGAAIIVAAALYITRREAQLRRVAAP